MALIPFTVWIATTRHLPFLDNAILAKDLKRPAEKVAACAVMTFPGFQVRVRLSYQAVAILSRRALVDIHEDGTDACHKDRLSSRCEGVHNGDHFVTRTDPARLQSKMERVDPRSHAHRMSHTYICSEILFEPARPFGRG